MLLHAALKVRRGDDLILLAPIQYTEFAEHVSRTALEAGCGKVEIFYENQPEEYEHYASGRQDKYIWIQEEDFSGIESAIQNGTLLLVLRCDYFGLFEKLNPEQKQLRDIHHRMDFYRIFQHIQANKVIYCLGALPNAMWANKVYPDLPEDEAVALLWQSMARAIYLDDGDPVGRWTERARELTSRRDDLNRWHFDSIEIRQQQGVLTLELPRRHLWEGGLLTSPGGRRYIPNIPTEEVFTTPSNNGVQGRLDVHKRIYFSGGVTRSYSLSFVDGLLADATSPDEQFADRLTRHLDRFDNGRRLGELALVSDDAGVKQQDMLFYDMVYDENASCHLAFGSSYRNTIQGGEQMDDSRFTEEGGNICQTHMDFMMDSENMEILGVKDGKRTPIIDHGRWVAYNMVHEE